MRTNSIATLFGSMRVSDLSCGGSDNTRMAPAKMLRAMGMIVFIDGSFRFE
jgi:hypothetical protein